MARLITSGFELNSIVTNTEVDSNNIPADLSTVNSPVHTGNFALQVATSASTSFVGYTTYAANTSAKLYLRAWVYIVALPTVTCRLMEIDNLAPVIQTGILLTPAGNLQLINKASAQIGANSSPLNTATWYCIELSIDNTVNNGTNEGRINGLVFASGAGTATSGNMGRVRMGLSGTANTGTVILDDIAVNDSTGGNQNGYPGLSQIIRAKPNATGDSNTFATNVGGSAGAANNFSRVNETNPNGATSYNANVTAASDLFKVNVPAVPTGATINCVVVGGDYANLTAADPTASFQWQIEKAPAGTISTSSSIIPNSTTFAVNASSAGASNYLLVLYNDPDGIAWTPTTIANMQIGYLINVAGTSALAISTVWALVDYTVPAPHLLSTLGVGT